MLVLSDCDLHLAHTRCQPLKQLATKSIYGVNVGRTFLQNLRSTEATQGLLTTQ